jgi:outer membrane protein assembly factor BamB
MGRVFAASADMSPGALYRIDPSQPAGAVTTVATNLGNNGSGITFDGARIWVANTGAPASVSIVTPGATLPWTVTTVTTGFSFAAGAIYDGANVWIADGDGHLFKLDPTGAILQTVTVNVGAHLPAFDGSNIWVSGTDPFDSLSVVRASTGIVLQTLTGNGLSHPFSVAFDGQRILVTNSGTDGLSLWKAADLTPIGNFPIIPGGTPLGACSDGVNFWITLTAPSRLLRF